MTLPRSVLLTSLTFASLLAPITAFACATCLCGDPTLTTIGNEKPFAGRLRASLNTLYREESIGETGLNERTITERRHTLGIGYWINERVAVEARLPWTEKKLEDDTLAKQQATGLGDLEVSARFYLWQDQKTRPQHLFGLHLGSRIPTASRKKIDSEPLDNDVQPGAGLWIPAVGVWYGYFQFPWSMNVSSIANLGAGKGYENFEFGKTLNTSVTGQYAINHKLALQLGLDTRISARNHEDGEVDNNSGGRIAYIAPGAIYTFAEDWQLQAKVQRAVYDDLNGDHDENTVSYLGIAYDF